MHPETQPARIASRNEAGRLPISTFWRARFVTWVFIFFVLTLGAGTYWFWSKEYQGHAAETINASKETVMTNMLVGYWTLDGNDIVRGDMRCARIYT